MGVGGKRPGAGRKKGSANKRTQEILAKAEMEGLLPLEFLLKVLRDETKDFKDRFAAAIQAAPYCHPRLANMNHTGHIDVKQWSDEQLIAARSAIIAATAVEPQRH